MVSEDQYFRINSPKVVHETLDGEVVIINFENGNYYSINDTGTDIWELLSRSVPVGGIIESMEKKYRGDQGDMERAIVEYLKSLEAENLIVADNPAEESEPVSPSENRSVSEKIPFTVPVLDKFDDMNELILLDPIHEVDEKGWPMTPDRTDT